MSELIVNYPDRAPERLPLGRLRITIGRSARNDVCLSDPFANRVHAEVRREGDHFVLQDLRSTNGTFYNGERVEGPVTLVHDGRIQIGETELIYRDRSDVLTTATVGENDPPPEVTIAFEQVPHTTSGLLEAIESASTQGTGSYVIEYVPSHAADAQINRGDEFYVVGGTLRPQAASYIERRADRELQEYLLAGDFCYVLTPRQMGKSSLMVHAAQQIRADDIVSVFVDLTLIGSEQGEEGANKWYYGIANTIIRGLQLKVSLKDWWAERSELTAVQRLTDFFSDIVLARTRERVVIFVDEIDFTIGLTFTDDFFAAIRACYNSRAFQPEFERLSFVLLGVASPSDLIKDEKKTPFNIGRAIHLDDFTFEEAERLANGLGTQHEKSIETLRRVLYWTGGHPYLTQKSFHLIAEVIAKNSKEYDVDRLVEEYFLSPKANREESNLTFVRDRLTRDRESLEILKVYERIAQGNAVTDNPLSAVHSALKLSGLVITDENRQMRVRNRIYEHVFTAGWARKEHRELQDNLAAYKELSSDLIALISKVGVTLLASATLDETLRQVALLVFDAVPAERCLIMLREPPESGELKIRVAEMRDRRPEVGEVRVDRTIVEEVVNQGRSVLTSDAQHDPRFRSSTVTFQGIRSVLAVPLGVGERIIGMIYADSPLATSRFTEDHLKVLTTLASVAAIRVENTRLLEEHLEQERFERELQLAREIQQRFQPTAPPDIPGYELEGISFPSSQIGGDYYDFIMKPSGHLALAVGDVSGRGTSAALLMSSLHAAVHAQIASQRSLVDSIKEVNRYLVDNTPANRFVTLFYAELDPLTGSLSFINAGHNPPIIAHEGGACEQLSAGGLPLGIVPDFDYREGHAQLCPGDVLVAYSDGVNELQNPADEVFGTVRLQEVIAKNLVRSAAGIRDKIEAALSAFAQGMPAIDDITLLIVRRVGTEGKRR